MRMILVHGINQQGKSAAIIRDEWIATLAASFARHGLGDPLSRLMRVDAAFFGDTLEQLSDGWIRGGTVSMGAEDTPDDFDEFAVDALETMAARMGISRAEIEAESAEVVVAQGAGIHKKWLKSVARAIQRVSPLNGTLALRVLGQAHAYIRNQHVHEEVNTLVRPLFEDDEPMLVVSHSLGTIVSLAILRDFVRNHRPREVPLLVTLGSPLGIDSVRKSFSRPRTAPAGTRRWVNGADPEDFVALEVALTERTFAPGIVNYPDIENGHDDPHAVRGYLSDRRIAEEIARVIGP